MAIKFGTRAGVREIVLSFDDGPHGPTTPGLLDLLAEYNIKAMFFVVGNRIKHSPAATKIVRRAYDEGHIIGNHSFTHVSNFLQMTDKEIADEILQTQDVIAPFSHQMRFLRPPGGGRDARVDAVLSANNFNVVMWDVDTNDWRPEFKIGAKWVAKGLEQIAARDDSVVLMHDIYDTTTNHVRDLIEGILEIPNTQFVEYA